MQYSRKLLDSRKLNHTRDITLFMKKANLSEARTALERSLQEEEGGGGKYVERTLFHDHASFFTKFVLLVYALYFPAIFV